MQKKFRNKKRIPKAKKSVLPHGSQSANKGLQEKLQQGKNFLQQERYNEAGAVFSSAMQENPESYEAAEYMGITCFKLKKYDVALNFFETLCKVNPISKARYLAYIGCIYGETDRYQECINVLEPISKQTQNKDIHTNLAMSYMYLGNKKASKDHLEKTLTIDPNNTFALCSYLTNAVKINDKNDPYFLKLKQKEKRISSLGTEDQANILYTLFAIHESFKEYETALNYAEKGSKIRKNSNNYNNNVFLQYFNYTKKYYTKETLEQLSQHKDRKHVSLTEKPVFIVAMPRSGTTLLEQILGNHRDIKTIGEDGQLFQYISEHASLPAYNNNLFPVLSSPDRKPPFWSPDTLAENYLEHIQKKVGQAERIIDKTIGFYFYLGYLRTAFPKAKFIHLKRDAVDSCISMFTHNFSGDQQLYSYDYNDLANRYCQYLDIMNYWDTLFPDQILNVNYEDIVEDLESTTKKILDFIDMPWDENCLKFYNNKKAVKTASVTQVRQPIYKQSVARWKRYGPAIKPLIEALGDCASEEAQNYLKEE